MAEMMLNEEHKGIEVRFDEKPAQDVLFLLKLHGFRWHREKKLWYAKQNDERMSFAMKLTGETAPLSPAPAPSSKKNKYGVQVGDILESSWGYEQTNVTFLQVVSLVGEQSVRVREVFPRMIDEQPTCGMAADRTYEISRELLPPRPSSVFIKNQEQGDLKRIRKSGNGNLSFNLSSFANAYYCEPGTSTVYESWYY